MATRGLPILLALLLAAPPPSWGGITEGPNKGSGPKPGQVLPAGQESLSSHDLTQLTTSVETTLGDALGGIQANTGESGGVTLPPPAAAQDQALATPLAADVQGPPLAAVSPNVPGVPGSAAPRDVSFHTTGREFAQTPAQPPVADAAGTLDSGGQNPLQPVRRNPGDRIWKMFMEARNDFGLNPKTKGLTEGELWASGVATKIAKEMHLSSRILPSFVKEEYRLLYSGMAASLQTIGHNRDHAQDREERQKFASYPLAGDPIHWGHLYSALHGAAKFGLSEVDFTFQGMDPVRKPNLTDIDIRRLINNAVLSIFGGLFKNSGIENTEPGEKNLFRMLGGPAIWYYFVGADHGKRYARETEAGKIPDTQLLLLQHMADRLFGFDPDKHKIVAAFILRDEHDKIEETELSRDGRVETIPQVPVKRMSSSRVKDEGRYDWIPYISFRMALRMAPHYLLQTGRDLWGLNHWIGQRSSLPTGND